MALASATSISDSDFVFSVFFTAAGAYQRPDMRIISRTNAEVQISILNMHDRDNNNNAHTRGKVRVFRAASSRVLLLRVSETLKFWPLCATVPDVSTYSPRVVS